RLILNFIGVYDFWWGMTGMLRYAFGQLDAGERSFIPATENPKVFFVARIWVAIYVATIALAIGLHSWIPILLVGTPRLYGCWHMVLCGVLQHGGLADNVTDHRL